MVRPIDILSVGPILEDDGPLLLNSLCIISYAFLNFLNPSNLVVFGSLWLHCPWFDLFLCIYYNLLLSSIL